MVGGPSSIHGIVSAASYEAKAYGIYSGMPMYLAKKKCPRAIVVAGNFQAYRDFSKKMFQIMGGFTPTVEVASIDEAYLDITGCELMHGVSAQEIARNLLVKIYENLGLSVSCGLASSKTVAKTASSLNKPHKLTVVPFGKEKAFLAPLSLRALPGIGPKTFALLESHGFEKVGDLSALTSGEVFGLFADTLGVKRPFVIPRIIEVLLFCIPFIGKKFKFFTKDRVYSTKCAEDEGFRHPYEARTSIMRSVNYFRCS